MKAEADVIQQPSAWASLVAEVLQCDIPVDADSDASQDKPTLAQYSRLYQTLVNHYFNHYAADESSEDEDDAVNRPDRILESFMLQFGNLIDNDCLMVIGMLAQQNALLVEDFLNGKEINFADFNIADQGFSLARYSAQLITLQRNLMEMRREIERWKQQKPLFQPEKPAPYTYTLVMLCKLAPFLLIYEGLLFDETEAYPLLHIFPEFIAFIENELSPQLARLPVATIQWPKLANQEVYFQLCTRPKIEVKRSFAEKFRSRLKTAGEQIRQFWATQPDQGETIVFSSPVLKAKHEGIYDVYNQVITQIGLIKADMQALPAMNVSEQTLFDEQFKSSWNHIVNRLASLIDKQAKTLQLRDHSNLYLAYNLLHQSGLMADLFALQLAVEQVKDQLTKPVAKKFNKVLTDSIIGLQTLIANFSDQFIQASTPVPQPVLDAELEPRPTSQTTANRAESPPPDANAKRKPIDVDSLPIDSQHLVTAKVEKQDDDNGNDSSRKKKKIKRRRPVADSKSTDDKKNSRKTPHLFNAVTIRRRTKDAPTLLTKMIKQLQPDSQTTVRSNVEVDPDGKRRELVEYPVKQPKKTKQPLKPVPGIQYFQKPQDVAYEWDMVRFIAPINQKMREDFIASKDPRFEESLRLLLVKHHYFDDDQFEESSKKAKDLGLREVYLRNLLAIELRNQLQQNHIQVREIIVGAKCLSVSFHLDKDQEAAFLSHFGQTQQKQKQL